MRTKGTILGVVLGLAIGLTIGGSLAQSDNGGEKSTRNIMYSVGWLSELAREKYVEEVDYDKLLEGATQGILATMDPYSSYLPPDMNKEFEASTKGEFGGLGIQIQFMPIEKVVRVESPIPGTPAFRKGVLAGDMIYEIVLRETGEVIKTAEFETVHDAVRVLRGKPGTKVTIKVLRGDTGRRAEFTIERAIIEIPGVRGAAVIREDPKIGYIYIPHFHQRMVDDLKEGLADLQDQGMEGLIVDLRFNPGGLLESATTMSDLFLEKGKIIVSTKGRTEPEDIHTAPNDDAYENLAIVVLVNGNSASASEIVAAALQDHHRALVVGESTFGKASVQKLFPHPRTEGAVKMTVARYYTPNGTLIEGDGVEPDVTVEVSDDDTRKLARYIAIKTDFVKKPLDELEEEEEEDEGENGEEDEMMSAKELMETFEDVQLQEAVRQMTLILSGERVIGEPYEEPAGAAVGAAE